MFLTQEYQDHQYKKQDTNIQVQIHLRNEASISYLCALVLWILSIFPIASVYSGVLDHKD